MYSSRTGNTRAVGEHLAGCLGLPLFSVEHAPSAGYDRFILGFWTWRGGPDEAMLSFMETLRNRSVFYFGTMAAFPDSPHAERCARRVDELLASVRAGWTRRCCAAARIRVPRNVWHGSMRPPGIPTRGISAWRKRACAAP